MVNASNDDKRRIMLSRKINHICYDFFEHCNMDVPGGKVLHLRRTLGMNHAKDNDVCRPDMHSITDDKTGNCNAQVVEDHCCTQSPSATMHSTSGATNTKEWKLNRACCSTHNFESMVQPLRSTWIQQRESVNGDKTDASSDLLHQVLANDERVITQDCMFHATLCHP